MTEYESEVPAAASGWVVGGLTFAGTMMILIGFFHAINGLAAIFEDEFFVAAANYAFDLDVTAWGWIHLIFGIALVVTGYFLFAGRSWAAIVAIAMAMLSAVANFFYVPYYPFWSLLVIALDIWVIWALTRPAAVVRG
jgi:hypothetical protein